MRGLRGDGGRKRRMCFYEERFGGKASGMGD